MAGVLGADARERGADHPGRGAGPDLDDPPRPETAHDGVERVGIAVAVVPRGIAVARGVGAALPDLADLLAPGEPGEEGELGLGVERDPRQLALGPERVQQVRRGDEGVVVVALVDDDPLALELPRGGQGGVLGMGEGRAAAPAGPGRSPREVSASLDSLPDTVGSPGRRTAITRSTSSL